jgi:hypothetical protein
MSCQSRTNLRPVRCAVKAYYRVLGSRSSTSRSYEGAVVRSSYGIDLVAVSVQLLGSAKEVLASVESGNTRQKQSHTLAIRWTSKAAPPAEVER